jgi:hypothetical protein
MLHRKGPRRSKHRSATRWLRMLQHLRRSLSESLGPAYHCVIDMQTLNGGEKVMAKRGAQRRRANVSDFFEGRG